MWGIIMRILPFLSLFILILFPLQAKESPWSKDFQRIVIEKVGQQLTPLSTYPSLEYPNTDYEQIIKLYPDKKVLLFGYGSLINAESAARTLSPEAVASMKPVAAFGFKRIFNYKASNVSRWGTKLPENERAMLNIEATTKYNNIINGVVMEITPEDLAQLIQREVGYDLVPMLVVDWNEMLAENPDAKVQIAYTFLAPDELRNGIDYTQTKYYPVRGYLHAAREGSIVYGPEFLNYWNATTYLGDGTTTVNQWDEKTFEGILDTKEP